MYHFLIFIVILIYIYETIKHIKNINKELLNKNNLTSRTQSDQHNSKEKFTSEVTLKYGFHPSNYDEWLNYYLDPPLYSKTKNIINVNPVGTMEDIYDNPGLFVEQTDKLPAKRRDIPIGWKCQRPWMECQSHLPYDLYEYYYGDKKQTLNTIPGEVVQEETVQEETVQEETVQEETIQEEQDKWDNEYTDLYSQLYQNKIRNVEGHHKRDFNNLKLNVNSIEKQKQKHFQKLLNVREEEETQKKLLIEKRLVEEEDVPFYYINDNVYSESYEKPSLRTTTDALNNLNINNYYALNNRENVVKERNIHLQNMKKMMEIESGTSFE